MAAQNPPEQTKKSIRPLSAYVRQEKDSIAAVGGGETSLGGAMMKQSGGASAIKNIGALNNQQKSLAVL
jgi:hypothetical protein